MHANRLHRLWVVGAAWIGFTGCHCTESDCSSELTLNTRMPEVIQAELSFADHHVLCDATLDNRWDCDFEAHSNGPTFKLRYAGSLPAQVQVVLRASDGREVWSDALKPEYHELRPNGQECPPACQTASATLER